MVSRKKPLLIFSYFLNSHGVTLVSWDLSSWAEAEEEGPLRRHYRPVVPEGKIRVKPKATWGSINPSFWFTTHPLQ